MKNKLIFIDVDGTLVNSQMVLSERTAEVCLRLEQEGHRIVLATGRPWRSLEGYYRKIHCNSPVVCYNGIHVFNPSDPSFPEVKDVFSFQDVTDIARVLADKATSFICESDQCVYLKVEDDFLNNYFPWKNVHHLVGPIENNLHEDVYTAIFRSAHEDDEFVKMTVESHPGMFYRHWSKSHYSEVYIPGVDKGSALRVIMKQLGFQKEDIFAFGDSENDRSMLIESGHPFAMNHCKSEALMRDFPTTEKGNDEDGVAETLAAIFFK